MMSSRSGWMRAFFARLRKLMRVEPARTAPVNARDFERACKELVFWTASDAGLSGPIEAFDGSVLHPSADGLFTFRMTLRDVLGRRTAGAAAELIVRSIDGLRVLALLDIDGCRFTYTPPHANAGVRELCLQFANRAESTER